MMEVSTSTSIMRKDTGHRYRLRKVVLMLLKYIVKVCIT